MAGGEAAAAAAAAAGVPFLEMVVAFILAVSALHTWLDLRQLRALRRPDPPPTLAPLFSRELYVSAQAYALDRWWFGTAKGLYSLAETLLILHLRALPWLWSRVPRWLPALQGAGEIPHTIAFVLIGSVAQTLLGLPWSAYSTFVVEHKHGFNKTTRSLFVTDACKTLLLTWFFVPPIVGGFTWILIHAGPWAPIHLWLFFLGLALLMLAIYPTVIAPLFNKYEQLPEGSLRSKIEGLAGGLKFPLKKLFTMDGSKRSAHSNAFMYGFYGNKRIVLFDTLIKDCSEAQVVAVLAHELGHWKLFHTPVNFAISQIIILVQFVLFTAIRSSPGLYESFGFRDARPAFIAFVLFQFVIAPVDEVVSCLGNLLSRRFEFQADAFAVGLGYGEDLRGALLALEKTNKAAMNVDPLYSAYHYSHPPLEERLEAIEAAQKKRS